MIEVTATYDFLPGVGQQSYEEFAQRAIGTILGAQGIVEMRANRNMMSSPQVRATYVFQTMTDWAKFCESDAYRALDTEVRKFVINYKIDIWGPSPVVPQPLRP
jgi:hypothetical protein